MAQRQEVVRERQLQRAAKAGERWQGLLARRAETVKLLKLGGPERADSPERVQLYRAREEAKQLAYARAGVTESFFAERRIGPTLDLDDTPPNDAARLAGVPVGRIVQLAGSGGQPEGFATGFLIAPNLIITNHHVFASVEECQNCGIQFGYEKVNGVLAAGTLFAFDAGRFFYTSEELDFTVVAVAAAALGSGVSLNKFRRLALIPSPGKILVGQAISIIQYPDGGPKKYGVRDNELLVAPSDTDQFLQYTTDTLPGSSGSPAFNKDWEVVGLHHSGVPEMENGRIMTIDGKPWTRDMPDSAIHWIANEGVRVSVICKNLSTASVKAAYQPALTQLVSSFGENFSRLPAVETQMEDGSMNSPTNATLDSSRGISITVQGTANFYIGRQAAIPQPPLLQTTVTQQPQFPVVVEKKLVFDPDYAHRPGFRENFLGVDIPLPDIKPERMSTILLKNGNALTLKYHHYSLVMNQDRRLQMWSAVNVDYTPSKRRKQRADFGTDTWIPDPRIAGDVQILDQELYAPAKKFDRGHIVRRDDTAWGETEQEEIFANSDSFHFTNSTPQHEQFNRAEFGYQGLWGELENHIKSQASNVGNKMCIFAGPILDDAHDIDHDFGGGPVKVPRRFWKVVLVTEDAQTSAPQLRAYGFILDQSQAISKYGLEAFSLGEFDTYQASLASISDATDVIFPGVVMAADSMLTDPHERKAFRIKSLEDLHIARKPAQKTAQAATSGVAAD